MTWKFLLCLKGAKQPLYIIFIHRTMQCLYLCSVYKLILEANILVCTHIFGYDFSYLYVWGSTVKCVSVCIYVIL